MMRRRKFMQIVSIALTVSLMMGAIGAPIRSFDPTAAGKNSIPVSQASDWVDICTDTATTDNSGSTVVNPLLITRAAQHYLNTGGYATTVQARYKYPTTATTPTGPVVQPFGLDRNNLPQRLLVSGSNELTLTVNTTTDARDGTYSYTDQVEFDADANFNVILCIKTAGGGSGLTGATLQLRVK